MTKENTVEEVKSENPFEGMDFIELAQSVNKEKEKEANKNAMKLVRVKVNCNNPNKVNYEGEIFTVLNSHTEIKKFVPFNVPTHIPTIMYNMLKEKECTVFKKKKINGIPSSVTKLIKEYTIEELPPISNEELEAIKHRQLADQDNSD